LVIADDHPLFRGALRLSISGLLEKVDIAEAGTFDDAVALLERGGNVIDLVLLDLAMPGMQAMFATFAGGPMTVEKMKDFFIKAFVVNPAVVDDGLVRERFELMKLQNPQVMKTMKVPNMTERLKEIACPALTTGP